MKLLTKTAYESVLRLKAQGMSLNTIHTKLGFTISKPTFNKLVNGYEHATELQKQSYLPEWLPEHGVIHSSPQNYTYSGYFPNGEWHRKRFKNSEEILNILATSPITDEDYKRIEKLLEL